MSDPSPPELLPNLVAALREKMGDPWEVTVAWRTFRESRGAEVRVGREFEERLMVGIVSFVPEQDLRFDEAPEWCSYVAERTAVRIQGEMARLN